MNSCSLRPVLLAVLFALWANPARADVCPPVSAVGLTPQGIAEGCTIVLTSNPGDGGTPGDCSVCLASAQVLITCTKENDDGTTTTSSVISSNVAGNICGESSSIRIFAPTGVIPTPVGGGAIGQLIQGCGNCGDPPCPGCPNPS